MKKLTEDFLYPHLSEAEKSGWKGCHTDSFTGGVSEYSADFYGRDIQRKFFNFVEKMNSLYQELPTHGRIIPRLDPKFKRKEGV